MTETDYPGDVHWYDLPDDEAETDETSAPESRPRRFITLAGPRGSRSRLKK